MGAHELHFYLLDCCRYTFQNNMHYIGFKHLNAAVGMATYQSKILFMALFSVLILKKRIKCVQWIGLCLLALGVICVQIKPAQIEEWLGHATNHSTTPFDDEEEAGHSVVLGVVTLTLAAMSTSVASVYLEKMLKSDTKPSLWLRNIQLATYSTIICIVTMAVQRDASLIGPGMFYGFEPLTWFSIFWQAAGGIMVAFTIKYADNILRCFAQAASIIGAAILSFFFASFVFTYPFVVGIVLVIISMFLYGGAVPMPCAMCEPASAVSSQRAAPPKAYAWVELKRAGVNAA